MENFYFDNPFADLANETPIGDYKAAVKRRIGEYVDYILENTLLDGSARTDIYDGNAGIAFMFWKLHQSEQFKTNRYLRLAKVYIRSAQRSANAHPPAVQDRFQFFVGNAGILAVAAAIAFDMGNKKIFNESILKYRAGIEIAKKYKSNSFGCELLIEGRPGYLAGIYWLRSITDEKVVKDRVVTAVCKTLIKYGRLDSNGGNNNLVYEIHGKQYYGAAKGLSGILCMLLKSPWFGDEAPPSDDEFENILTDIKTSIMFYANNQNEEGNFFDMHIKNTIKNNCVNWSYGSSGILIMLATAYLVYKDHKLLDACRKASDLIWQKGLTKTAPGLCNGIAGNGYAFLIMYRITGEQKYLYRAIKFAQFLTFRVFKPYTYKSDYPCGLFSGLAGTVCFLVDLLKPHHADFPFMDIF